MRRILTPLFIVLNCFCNAQDRLREIDSLEQIVITNHDPEQVVLARTALVKKYYSAGMPDKAEHSLKQAEKTARDLGSDMATGEVLHTRGVMFYYQSKFDSALRYFEAALESRKQAGDKVGLLKTMANIAGIHYMTMDYKKAIAYSEEALRKEQEFGFPEGKYVSISNIASIYNTLRLYERALHYLRKAENIYSASQQEGNLAYTYEGFSTAFEGMGKYDSALYYSLKTLALTEKLHDQNGVTFTKVNLGIIYNHMKRYAEAEKVLKEALEGARLLGDKRLELGIHGNLAVAALEQNRMDTALFYLDKVIKLQDELQYKKNEEYLSKLYAEYYYRRKDFKNAYDYMKLYDRVRDSIYNLETTGQIAEMQERFETEKKEKENQLLQAENRGHKITRNYLLGILALACISIIGGLFAFWKIKTSRKIISGQKELVEEKQKEILDSINYARRIQFALLSGEGLLRTHLPEYFVLFKPRDVVSGDFYWATPTADGFVYVTADCTGHGVPGAFMSLLNISKLSQTINEQKITRPAEILNNVRTEIIKALNPAGSTEQSKDGMDAIVCRLNLQEMKLEYAAANNSFYIVRNNNMLYCRADKMPVGMAYDMSPFSNNDFSLQPGDVIYTLTDGFADQFGGSMGKKFKYRQLENLILEIHRLPMETQKQKLEAAFEKWRGDLEQVDDVCIIGVKIS